MTSLAVKMGTLSFLCEYFLRNPDLLGLFCEIFLNFLFQTSFDPSSIKLYNKHIMNVLENKFNKLPINTY